MNDRQVANGSANQTKADLFARGAADTIVGDLKQEMAAGSTTFVFPTPTPSGVTLYTSTKSATAVPFRVGSAGALPNLVKRSTYSQASYSGTNYDTTNYPASNRASQVSSTATSSNGRSMSLARWNSHYLLPKKQPGSDTDATPVAAFTAPDWVLVSRDGTNPTLAATATLPSNLRDSSSANGAFVVGRYAYAIYNEGGLLDMNVAGYPTGTTSAQLLYKPAVAFADLTQLGLTQSQVDQIVGWRNYASAAPTGNFPAFAFSPTQATNYYNFVLGNWRALGFLTTANQTLNSSQTDRMFSSRQSLIRLLVQGLGGSGADSAAIATRANLQNTLQYMGTFSRDLDQPSFAPNASRPKVQSGPAYNFSSGTVPYVSSYNVASFGTGNDAYGVDRDANASKDINPPLLSVRATSIFARADGSMSVIGEPLIKKRFPLSRIDTDKLLRTATASKVQTDPIYRDFGIYRSSTSAPWHYDHGDPKGILRLSAITGREPDFFELLKAGINIGSLAKTALQSQPSSAYATTGTMSYAQSVREVKTALQILQIGADIIDQWDSDGYPTRIALEGDTVDEVRGIEDLPYIYQIRERWCFPTQEKGRYLMQPEIWNPHDSSGIRATDAPSRFRIRLEPHDKANGLTHTSACVLSYYGPQTADGPACDWDSATPVGTTLTFNAGEATGFYGFRDPTLLARANLPAGTNVSGNETVEYFNTTASPLVGLIALDGYPLYIPKSPVVAPNPSKPGAENNFLSKINWDNVPPATSKMCWIDYFMEYWDGTQWIPHDAFNQYLDGNGRTHFHTGVTNFAAELSELNSNWKDVSPVAAIDNGPCNAGVSKGDPRTQRFLPSNMLYMQVVKMIDFSKNTYESLRGGTSYGHAGNNIGNWDDSGFKEKAYYAKDGRGNQYSYWEENSIRATYQDPTLDDLATDQQKRFNRDPDGVARRAMGGYVTDPTNGGSLTQYVGLPNQNGALSSRPLILNRKFQSIAELGYVFRGDNWKNLSFSFPESGDSALLDLFCINEVSTSDAMVAGRVDLNTAQVPVLKAILVGANTETTAPASTLSAVTAGELAQALVTRTSNTDPNVHKAPLTCRSDLVGAWHWNGDATTLVATMRSDPNPDTYYSGFSSDIGTVPSLNGKPEAFITRKREAAIRALVDAGTARVWNLLIDVVAQTGRFSPNASKPDQFTVEGEKHYWLHVSIDRTSGKILDQQLEAVSE